MYILKQITPTILASGSLDGTIKLWDTSSGQLIRTLTGHTGYIYYSLDIMANGGGGQTTLVSGSTDRTLKIWNWSNGQVLSTTESQGRGIYSLAVIDLDKEQQQQTTTTTTGE